jgi:hypothetical protein
MASDASGFNSRNQDGALAPHAPHRYGSRDRIFFRRVVQANGAIIDLMKSSAIKLAESQKLLAEVDALLRR